MSPANAKRTTGGGLAPPAEPTTVEIAAARRSPRVSRGFTAAKRSRVAGCPHRGGHPAGRTHGLMTSQVGLSPCCWVQKTRHRARRPTAAGVLAPRIPAADGSPSETWIPVISLSPSFWPKPALLRVERRGGVAALGEPAHRLGARVGVVLRHVEQEARVESVALRRAACRRRPRQGDQVPGRRRRRCRSRRAPGRPCRRASAPVSADGSFWRELEDHVQPPQQSFSGLVAFVSPVSSK